MPPAFYHAYDFGGGKFLGNSSTTHCLVWFSHYVLVFLSVNEHYTLPFLKQTYGRHLSMPFFPSNIMVEDSDRHDKWMEFMYTLPKQDNSMARRRRARDRGSLQQHYYTLAAALYPTTPTTPTYPIYSPPSPYSSSTPAPASPTLPTMHTSTPGI